MKLTRTIKQASLALASLSMISLSAMAADEKKDADNTALNQRDRSGETATSGDQANSSGDLKITQAIRQALVKDGELSTTAKNIKVITANGQVTLRGPVNNAQEKARSIKSRAPREAERRLSMNSTSKTKPTNKP